MLQDEVALEAVLDKELQVEPVVQPTPPRPRVVEAEGALPGPHVLGVRDDAVLEKQGDAHPHEVVHRGEVPRMQPVDRVEDELQVGRVEVAHDPQGPLDVAHNVDDEGLEGEDDPFLLGRLDQLFVHLEKLAPRRFGIVLRVGRPVAVLAQRAGLRSRPGRPHQWAISKVRLSRSMFALRFSGSKCM